MTHRNTAEDFKGFPQVVALEVEEVKGGSALKGDNLTLECSAEGSPLPTLHWSKGEEGQFGKWLSLFVFSSLYYQSY